MKIRLLALFVFLYHTVCSQLTISPGAGLTVLGNAQLTLNNAGMINDGSFTAGTGRVSFTGNSSSFISGNQPLQFYELEINKTAGSELKLQRMINIAGPVSFTQGFLNLNGFNADLGTTGFLNGENENSRVTGIDGGQLLFTTTLVSPSSVNPANLGAIITASENLGNVIIRRGHQSQVNAFGVGTSVLRYYDIIPALNTGINATLRFHYFDGELNSLNEGNLVLWRSPDNIRWTNQAFSIRNAILNYVEKGNISSFSRWTLSPPDNALPVEFILFNVKCEGNRAIITWKTAQEQNTSHFVVEKSLNASGWSGIGTLPAAGNSVTERSYSFVDNTVTEGNYYRIAQHDIDGNVQYTSIIRLSCDALEQFRVWPNPFTDVLFVNIQSNSRSPVMIKIFDAKGSLVKVQQGNILQGSNQLIIDTEGLATGMYQLAAEWNGGQMQKAVKVVKQ